MPLLITRVFRASKLMQNIMGPNNDAINPHSPFLAPLTTLKSEGEVTIFVGASHQRTLTLRRCLHWFLVNNCWFKINCLQDQPIYLRNILCLLFSRKLILFLKRL